jgi:hypothetical protein
MIVRVGSSKNSTRTCVTPPREPVRPRTCNQWHALRQRDNAPPRTQIKRTLMTRASFTGAFDESCFRGVRDITTISCRGWDVPLFCERDECGQVRWMMISTHQIKVQRNKVSKSESVFAVTSLSAVHFLSRGWCLPPSEQFQTSD